MDKKSICCICLEKQIEFVGYTQSRLCGPDTIQCVSIKVNKVDLDHVDPQQDRHLIQQWSNYIDDMVRNEMERSNDMAMMFTPPQLPLSKEELWLAIQCSQFALYALPYGDGYIVSHPDSVYLSCVSMGQNDNTSLYFDKDDGFLSCFGGPVPNHLNDFFNQWKDNHYIGLLQDYY